MLFFIQNERGLYITKWGTVTKDKQYALQLGQEFANVLVNYLNNTDGGKYKWTLVEITKSPA